MFGCWVEGTYSITLWAESLHEIRRDSSAQRIEFLGVPVASEYMEGYKA